MLSLPALVVCLAAGAGDTVLIDFSATWCGPCRQMEPVVARMAAAGYPVRKVDIDQERELASRFRVGSIPCFVLVVNGREADRIVGATSQEQLQALLHKHGVSPGSQVNQTRGQSPDARSSTPGAGRPNAASIDRVAAGQDRRRQPQPAERGQPVVGDRAKPGGDALDPALGPRLLASSVRLKVHDPKGHSFGSGTIIDAQNGNALVLTCGHLFRDSKGKGQISIDTFGPEPERGLPGRLLGYDLETDVGLVSFQTARQVMVARVAPPEHTVRRGDAVINIGCNNGNDPTVRQSRVTSIDKFLGPANLQVAGQPVVGRSGGGLFNARGEVIGVCNAADPTDDEGLYAALPSIRAELDRRGLAAVHQQAPRTAPAMLASATQTNEAFAAAPPNMPQRMPAVATSDLVNVGARTTGAWQPVTDDRARQPAAQARAAQPAAEPSASHPASLAVAEQAVLGAVSGSNPAAEVICIVRPRANPAGKSEIVVLDTASQAFLQQLAVEQRAQTQQTSLEVARQAPAASNHGPRFPVAQAAAAPQFKNPVSGPQSVARPQTSAGVPRRPAWLPHWLQRP